MPNLRDFEAAWLRQGVASTLLALVLAQSAAAQDVAALELRIARLEARISELETRLEGPLTVKAPFIVTREQGEPLFSVEQEDEGAALGLMSLRGEAGVSMHVKPAEATLEVSGPAGLGVIESTQSSVELGIADSANDPTAEAIELVLDNEGANLKLKHNGRDVAVLGTPEGKENALKIYDSKGAVALTAGVTGQRPGIALLRGKDKKLAELGPGSGENTALRIYGGTGKVVAAIGEDAQGQGGVRVANSAGALVASMAASDTRGVVHVLANSSPVAGIEAQDGRGVVAVFNDSIPVAYLTRSSAGDGGNVTVSLNSGFGVFSAGAAQDGGGEACVNRRTGGGKEKVACLGIDLPSMGLAK